MTETSTDVAAKATPEWYDDYTLGHVIVSPSTVVAEDDVRAYARFSNDVRPLLGTESARLVPSMFLFCVGVGLLLHGSGGYIPRQFVAFFGFDDITFHAQATAGNAVHSTARVIDLTPRGRNGLVTYAHQTSLVSGEPLVSSTQRILVARRPNE